MEGGRGSALRRGRPLILLCSGPSEGHQTPPHLPLPSRPGLKGTTPPRRVWTLLHFLRTKPQPSRKDSDWPLPYTPLPPSGLGDPGASLSLPVSWDQNVHPMK